MMNETWQEWAIRRIVETEAEIMAIRDDDAQLELTPRERFERQQESEALIRDKLNRIAQLRRELADFAWKLIRPA